VSHSARNNESSEEQESCGYTRSGLGSRDGRQRGQETGANWDYGLEKHQGRKGTRLAASGESWKGGIAIKETSGGGRGTHAHPRRPTGSSGVSGHQKKNQAADWDISVFAATDIQRAGALHQR